MKHDWNIQHDTTKNEVPLCRLKSRKRYSKSSQEILSVIPEDRLKDACIAATRKHEWEASGPTRVHRHVSDSEESANGEDLRLKHWTTLSRLHTGVGRYKASLKKWGLAGSAACECEQNRQLTTSSTAAQYIDYHPNMASSKFRPLAIAWLQQTELNI